MTRIRTAGRRPGSPARIRLEPQLDDSEQHVVRELLGRAEVALDRILVGPALVGHESRTAAAGAGGIVREQARTR